MRNAEPKIGPHQSDILLADREGQYQILLSRIPARYRVATMRSCELLADTAGKEDAWTSALSYLSDPGGVFVLSGPNGSGKTWLATAVYKNLLWNASGRDRQSFAWHKAYSMLRHIQSGYRDGTAHALLRGYQRASVLLIDDLGDIDRNSSDDRAQIVYELIDSRHSSLLPTIVTTNLGQDALIANYGERTWNRLLETSVMAQMTGRNFRENPL